MILRKREEGEGTNLFVCEGPHSEELLPGQDELYAILAFIDHPMETEAMERGIFFINVFGQNFGDSNNLEHHMSWKR